MSIEALEAELRKGDVGTVVVTLGTTAIGAVDPLDEMLELRVALRLSRPCGRGLRRLLPADPDSGRAGAAGIRGDRPGRLHRDRSAQARPCSPTAAAACSFAIPAVGRFYKHDSPYTYFTSKQLHLGEISLECSRAGASAVALWATQQLLPLVPGGEFARGLGQRPRAALESRPATASG